MNFISLIVCLYSFIKPSKFLTIYLILIFFPITTIENLFAIDINQIKVLPYLVLLCSCIGTFIIDNFKVRNFFYDIPKLTKLILFLYTLTLFYSGYINNRTLIDTVFSLRWIIGLLSISYLMLRYYTKNNLTNFIKIFIIIGFVQIPVTIFQRFYLVPLLDDIGDVVTGTFPQYYQLIFFQLFLIGIILLSNKHKIRYYSINTYLLIILLIVPLVFSNAKAVFIFLPIVILYSITSKPIKIRSITSIALLITPIFFISLYTFNIITQYTYNLDESLSYAYLINYDYIWNYVTRGVNSQNFLESIDIINSDFGRLGNIIFNFNAISHSIGTLLFGLGGIKFLESSKTGLVLDFDIPYVLHSTIARTIGIAGIIGTLLIILFYFSLRNKSKDSLTREDIIQTNISKILFILLFMTSIYFNNLQSFYTYLFISLCFLKIDNKSIDIV